MFRFMSAAVIAAALWFAVLTAGMTRNFDFRAFYCGGAAVLQRADPYRVQPLHSCEVKKTDGAYAAFARQTVLPAPQPPYVLGVFALFALLPFSLASKLWAALLLCAAAGAIFFARAVARVPLAAAVAGLWLSLCVTSIYLGELIPVFVCALAAAAYCLQKRWWTAAGCCAVFTLTEPHLGLAVCASMALWVPRSRKALILGAAVLLAISAAAVSAPVALEYLQKVLPLHALSEIGSDAQLSASVLAHKAGASNGAAMRVGTVSFALAAVLGICVAPSLARIYRERAFLALTPAAFSLIGGVFLHVTDLAAAIPLVLLLHHHEPDRRAPIGFVLVLLAVPWVALTTPMLLGTVPGCTLAAVAVFYLARWTGGSDVLASVSALAAGAGSFLLVSAYQAAAAHAAGAPAPPIPGIYPQASWAAFTAAFNSTSVWPAWILRGLSWLALFLMAADACERVAQQPSRLFGTQASLNSGFKHSDA